MAALGWRRTRRSATPQLRVDPVACDGIGICAHLAPDVVAVDSWGYPMLGPVHDQRELRQARSAAAACPRKALFLSDPPS